MISTGIVRKLRNNMTDAEKKLWYVLRMKNLGVKFRRQGLIGKYIVDFVCYERKLIIEADGGQHNESQSDKTRDKWLESQGFKVLRFWNNDIFENLDGVGQEIIKALASPSPALPTRGREQTRTKSTP
jgi:very-short-patch-repair endonuclease